jgi:DNA-binding MarR family transcriptional regulator
MKGRNEMGVYTFRNPVILKILLITLIFALFSWSGVSSAETTMVGTVTDASSGDPIANADITVFISGTEELVAQTTSDSDGYYEIPGLSEGTYTVKINAEGYIDQSQEVVIEGIPGGENAVLLDVQLNPRLGGDGGGEPETDDTPFGFIYPLFFIITVALIVSLVMYSKIKKENLLKNAQRKRIYEYITEKPGMHYRAILSDLDLPMGVLSYHLNRLEKGQYIKSRQDGMYRRFYMKSTRTDMRFFLSDIQESIFKVIKENQGISQSKIAKKINVSRKVVNYHVNILDQAGLIFVESKGRESACFVNELKPATLGESS